MRRQDRLTFIFTSVGRSRKGEEFCKLGQGALDVTTYISALLLLSPDPGPLLLPVSFILPFAHTSAWVEVIYDLGHFRVDRPPLPATLFPLSHIYLFCLPLAWSAWVGFSMASLITHPGRHSVPLPSDSLSPTVLLLGDFPVLFLLNISF